MARGKETQTLHYTHKFNMFMYEFHIMALEPLCKQESHNIIISFTWQKPEKKRNYPWLLSVVWRKRKEFPSSSSAFLFNSHCRLCCCCGIKEMAKENPQCDSASAEKQVERGASERTEEEEKKKVYEE